MTTQGLRDRLSGRLARGRAMAEARMLSEAVVMRKTGDMVTDPDGFKSPEWATVLTSPFRLGGADAGSSGSRTVTIGGAELNLALRTGHFPHDTVGLADGDLIEILAGENAGLVLRIVEATWQDQATARRVPVVEAQRPEEWD